MGHLGQGRLQDVDGPYNHAGPRCANAGKLRHVWPPPPEKRVGSLTAGIQIPASLIAFTERKGFRGKSCAVKPRSWSGIGRAAGGKQGLEQAMELGDLFSFDKKVAPSIIKPIYWVGMVLIIFVNIIYFFFGFGRLFTVGFFTGVWEMLAAIVSTTFGVLGLRIGAELCLAIFEIHEKTTSSSGN
jgi:hypothetical protein